MAYSQVWQLFTPARKYAAESADNREINRVSGSFMLFVFLKTRDKSEIDFCISPVNCKDL